MYIIRIENTLKFPKLSKIWILFGIFVCPVVTARACRVLNIMRQPNGGILDITIIFMEQKEHLLCNWESHECKHPKIIKGNFVHAGNILATQRLMRWQPGAHVGIGTNNTLYALEDGIVRFTKEVYVPAPRSTETFKVITKLPTGTVLYKTFINIVPNKQEGKFKLVGMF
ncbi:large ribosomal subunit protein bL27m-like isoform X2 [Oncorhynchus nerka]|uniref:large ribosomal subunit protein bL27m-like isoform X2 n=1 Tax=Oncorhynchus nerka TaxID=8023 RepID=UPI0031B802E3